MINPPSFNEEDWTKALWFSSISDDSKQDHAFVTVTAAYSVAANVHLIRVDATAGAVVVALPPAATFPGRRIFMKKIDSTANAATLSSVDLIDGSATRSTSTQYGIVGVMSVGTTWDRIEQ